MAGTPPPSPPPSAASLFSPGTPAPPTGSVEHANVLSTLDVGRVLTKVWVLIGGLVALLNLVSIFLSLLTLTFPGGGLGGLIYAIIWIGVDLVILGLIGGWMSELSAGRYTTVKEPILLWGILGLIFGVVPGVILLLVYLRVMPWADSPPLAPTPPPPTPSPPPASAPPAAPPAQAASATPPPASGPGAPAKPS